MSAPKRSVPTKKGRYYTDPQNTAARYVSVTNVIDTLNKPALVAWAAKTVAEEAVANVVQLVKMSRTDKPAAVSWLKGKPYETRDAAAKLGSRVHDLAEQRALGHDLGEIEPDAAAMVEQYLAFEADFAPVFEATEATVVNRTHGYAGTLDALVRIPVLGDRLLVLDYKTGKSGPYPEWGMQLAAYAAAEALWLPDDSEVPVPPVDGGAVLRLRPDGYALYEYDLTGMLDIFLSLLTVTRWHHSDNETAISGPVIPAPAPATTAAEVA